MLEGKAITEKPVTEILSLLVIDKLRELGPSRIINSETDEIYEGSPDEVIESILNVIQRPC